GDERAAVGAEGVAAVGRAEEVDAVAGAEVALDEVNVAVAVLPGKNPKVVDGDPRLVLQPRLARRALHGRQPAHGKGGAGKGVVGPEHVDAGACELQRGEVDAAAGNGGAGQDRVAAVAGQGVHGQHAAVGERRTDAAGVDAAGIA